MGQVVASIAVTLVLSVLVLRDVLVDHGRVLRATWSEHEDDRRDERLTEADPSSRHEADEAAA